MRNIYFTLLLLITGMTGNVFSQTITIVGPSTVEPGTEAEYVAEFDYNPHHSSTINWSVSGGTIIYQTQNPTAYPISCTVQWNESPGTGSISISEDIYGGYGEKTIEIRQQSICEQADAGSDVSFCVGNSTTIGTPAISGYTYSWSPITGLSDPNIAQPTASPSNTTTYTLTMKQNLLINGDFEQGTNGFITDYAIYPASHPICSSTGRLYWGTNPSNVLGGWCNYSNHTPTGNYMLMVDGSCRTNDRIWSQTVNVDPNKIYTFSGWARCNSPFPAPNTIPLNNPVLRVVINGIPVIQNFTVINTDCAGDWIEFTTTWSSGSNVTATIDIIDDILATGANDFSLDDLIFYECPTTTDQVTVFVGPNTSPTITPSGTNKICSFWESASNPAVLTTNLTSNLQWYRNGIAIPGATNQTYTAYADNGQGNIVKTYSYTVKSTVSGCTFESSATTINFVPTPFIFMSTNACRNSPITLYATDYGPGSNYSWNIPGAIISPNSNSRQISVTFPSSYTSSTFTATLNVTNSYNCNGSNQQTFTFFTSCRTINSGNIKLFPNPANDQLMITAPDVIKEAEIISLLNAIPINRKVSTNGTNSVTVNVSKLKPGLYSCKIVTQNGIEYLKLLIER